MAAPAFQQRWPWIGPDLQTLRDTLRPDPLPADTGIPLAVDLPEGGQLLAVSDHPVASMPLRGLVLLVHGLAGDSGRPGVRRLALLLQQAGLGVWRLNLRGAGPGRPLAQGTYAAACSADLWPVLAAARRAAAGLPLLGVGLSLGGTVLLNALQEDSAALDGVACVSSPLDLEASALQIERPRNRLYATWLLRRLIAQTLADPMGLSAAERARLEGPARPQSIRAFDAAITAPRWGYGDVNHYYASASPGPRLLAPGPRPPILLVHALDDPWVPAAAAQAVAAASPAAVQVLLSPRGGHNGFHARETSPQVSLHWGDGPPGPAASWADWRVLEGLLAWIA
jgi:predicted alpha/beta-fold hydrolase